MHAGRDIGGSIGDPVYAAANGKVVDTGYNSARGNFITISHPSGLKTNYMHLSKILTKVGATVKQGDTIAELGSTGRSTGPHLHIEVVKNGSTVDPAKYLRKPGEEE
ncbi:Murein DD-endopeptidase MepM [compost metagenome]